MMLATAGFEQGEARERAPGAVTACVPCEEPKAVLRGRTDLGGASRPVSKILFVTGIFPPDAGGPASYVPKLAAALCRRGYDVDVVTLSDQVDHDDRAWLFRVHRIRRRLFWPWRILFTIFTIWRIARLKDVVYVNGLGSEAALAAWLCGRPAVHKVVGDYAWERAQGRGWFRGTLDEYQQAAKPIRLRLLDLIRTVPIRYARQVIVPSAYLWRIVVGWGIAPRKVRVIYNAVPAKQESSSPNAGPQPLTTLITVCRLVAWKGVDALIRIVATMPQTRLVVVGDGPLRLELEMLAQSLGAGQRITFVGQAAGPRVRSLLQAADIFVLNSTYEGLPHVVLEAMEAGIPVIATAAGGTGEVVEDGVTGLLVPPGDEDALRAALANLCGDCGLRQRFRAEARRRLATRFSFETMVGETEACLTFTRRRGEPNSKENGGLRVLSLGYTRGLWDGPGAEDYQRMLGYGAELERYVIIANSYKRHRLTPRRLAPNVEAIPTDAYTPLDSLVQMVLLGGQALRQQKFSLIQAQDPCFTGLAALALGKLFHLPIVVCVYGPNVYDPHWRRNHWTHRLLAPLGRFVLRRARSIQVDGRLTARSLMAAGHRPEQVEIKPVIPGNLDRFLAIPRTDRPSAAPRILYVGRLARQKNLALLLQAARRLCDRGRRFELVMVGDGPEESALRKLAEESGLQDCVRFRGTVSRSEIVRVFTEADVFAMSSDYEGFARVLMEAAAAALPIVTTAVSGSDDAVEDGVSGFLVPVRELDPFVEKLDLLIADAELRLRMGDAGRRHVAERLDPATNAPRQLAIWRKAAS